MRGLTDCSLGGVGFWARQASPWRVAILEARSHLKAGAKRCGNGGVAHSPEGLPVARTLRIAAEAERFVGLGIEVQMVLSVPALVQVNAIAGERLHGLRKVGTPSSGQGESAAKTQDAMCTFRNSSILPLNTDASRLFWVWRVSICWRSSSSSAWECEGPHAACRAGRATLNRRGARSASEQRMKAKSSELSARVQALPPGARTNWSVEPRAILLVATLVSRGQLRRRMRGCTSHAGSARARG